MWTFSDDGAEIRGSKTAFFSPSDESSRSESIWKIQSFQNQINLKRTDYCSLYSDAMIIHSIYGQLSVWGKSYLFYEIPASIIIFPIFTQLPTPCVFSLQLPQIARFEISIYRNNINLLCKKLARIEDNHQLSRDIFMTFSWYKFSRNLQYWNRTHSQDYLQINKNVPQHNL